MEPARARGGRSCEREVQVENAQGSGGDRRDALKELQARVEAAIEEARPKVKRALDELDTRVDAAMAEIRPRAQNAMEEVKPRVDQFVADVQPRLDSILSRLQGRIEELRKDLDERATRTSKGTESTPAGELPPGASGQREDEGPGAP
jgi:F0F1-type ATP synthase membrane subunit b/b'